MCAHGAAIRRRETLRLANVLEGSHCDGAYDRLRTQQLLTHTQTVSREWEVGCDHEHNLAFYRALLIVL